MPNERVKGSRIRMLLFLIILIAASPALHAQEIPPDWRGWKFLLGTWIGEGSGKPGEGGGGFSFTSDLQNTVLIRRNFAEYPSVNGRPAFRHDDLTVVYHDAGRGIRAMYYDNEGHVISYGVTFTADSSSLVFVSEPANDAPRFRFTYTKRSPDTLGLSFEIAPPGTPEKFSPYITARAHRQH
jgi:hypothetical protein